MALVLNTSVKHGAKEGEPATVFPSGTRVSKLPKDLRDLVKERGIPTIEAHLHENFEPEPEPEAKEKE